ncbi:YgiQ family radical SAM protein [Christensenellaceae bacterium NSJ-63]|uniref:YgiQ family radical SAM protein n=1 Tax=Guopingia tenuis TaxID=2763656 RepID=A0A926DFC0_9FIRM|nr:YgiQ family radical SAM protein [Guopingia tenuis]MBC8537880.1 YgiQ family radical SAM protein [Guopingia tenuis]
MTKKDLQERGIAQPDFILVSADAYVDHPSFANALIGRYLEALGYSVALLCQPNFGDLRAYQVLGRPRLAFLVSGGNMDSMVNRYTANKAPRKKDLYSPGGAQRRPKRATIVYTQMLRRAYPDVPIAIGGVEASLRRFAHYDYWDNAVRPSILEDAPADLLMYGMGEHPLKELAEALDSGLAIGDITYIRGTAYRAKDDSRVYEEKIMTPSFEEVKKDKRKYAEAFRMQYLEQDYRQGRVVVQPHGDHVVIQNPPAEPLSTEEMDFVYSLPFTKEAHPSYKEPIPALQEVKFSLVSSRGCYGGCSFCSIFFHQGKYIQSRSQESLVAEAEELTRKKDFKGYIHDVGGPTANFLSLPCEKAKTAGMCRNRRCLAPTPCKNLKADHSRYIATLRALRAVPGVKKVFIRSGIRYDYVMADKSGEFIRELARHHVSGELKVAPEHCAPEVLRLMGKPNLDVYERFVQKFEAASRKAGKKQYVLPYFIASHPGSTIACAIELAVYLKRSGFVPDQAQDFYPTPGSLSTCMYYTGLDPLTMEPVYVPKSREERAMQRALLQFNKPENYPLVKKALLRAGRRDLIGKGRDCLIRG